MTREDHMRLIAPILFCLSFGIATLAFLGAFPFEEKSVLAQDQQTKDILEHVEELWRETGSYHAETLTVIEKEGNRKVTKRKAKFKWPNMSWREIRKENGRLMGLVISNGKIKWNYMPSIGFAKKYHKGAMMADAKRKGWSTLDFFDQGDFQYKGKEQLGKNEMFVFEGEQSSLSKQKNPERSGKARVYISTHDGIVRKFISYDKNGKEVASQTFSEIRKDSLISDKDFEFIPPEGTQIHEIKDVGSRANPEK